MDSDPAKSSLDFGDPKSRSPLRKMTEQSVIGRMLSRTKLAAKSSFDESFDMVSDFSPGKRDKKRAREAQQLPYLLSPERKQHRPLSPSDQLGTNTAPPVAYRSPRPKQSLPPRLDSRPIPPTPRKEPALYPLPASPSKSASSWSSHLPQLGTQGAPSDNNRAGTPDIRTSPRHTQTSPRRNRAQTKAPRSPAASPDIFTEFDRLFADFPHPPPGMALQSPQQHLPSPALTGTASSYTSSSGHSRPSTPLSPHPAPDPARLGSAINTLSQVILCLQGAQAEQATYALRQEDTVAKAHGMERELAVLRAENLRLEVSVRREGEERLRAENEREDLRVEMKRRATTAEEHEVGYSICFPSRPCPLLIAQNRAATAFTTLQSQANASAQNTATLQSHFSASQSRCAALESHAKSVEAEVSRLTGAFDIIKDDYRVKEEEMRRRMEEAEFMHQALKESGARLGRELDGARKKYSELEKKGRGGYI